MDDDRLSRRSLLAAAATGAGALIAAPSAAGAPEGFGELFDRWVGTVAGTTPVIPTGRRFALVGVHWCSPERAAVQLRARLAGGRWSRWLSAAAAGHGPDRASGGVGEPLWAGDADAVQLRSAERLSGVRLRFVAAGAGGAAGAAAGWARARTAAVGAGAGAPRAARRARAQAAGFPLAAPDLPAGPGQPPIIARSAWAGSRARPAVAPSYGAVRLAFVHHTDNLNGYSAAQVPSMIYAIYLYHRYSNGWNDIGYNFVIDDFGRIWEARAGGIDLPVVGAQAGGYNLESTGVAILGTFQRVLPSAAALGALERLLAWKLALHGLPASGQVRVEVDPADAFYTPFRPGQVISLPRVAGHRQGCSTDCPGNDLFAHLPAVRARVARLAGRTAKLTLSAVGASRPAYLSLAGELLAYGRSLTLSGRLSSLGGTPYAGVPVALEQVLEGASRTLATLETAADGSFSAPLNPAAGMLVRAVCAQAPATVSPLLAVAVAPVITLSVSAGPPLQVAGTVAPAAAVRSLTLELERQGARGRVRRRRVAVSGGRFEATVRGVGSGSYVLVARSAASARYAAASSAPVAVTVP